jgi:hypothetical protein
MRFNRMVIQHKSEGNCNDVFVIFLNLTRNNEHYGKYGKDYFPQVGACKAEVKSSMH